MKDSELQFDRICHVLYSGPCKKEILAKIALHYPEAEREAVWEKVQRQYVWQLVDIWLPAPLDFGQFQRIGCFQCMIVACHI